jgi:hypothetical protein
MNHRAINVLLTGESQRGWWHLANHLEHLGCHRWFASTTEEVRALLGQRPFQLILSARPVTEHGPLIHLLRGPGRSVYYSVPVDGSCLWFQALPETSEGQHISALRPSEFVAILDDFIADQCVKYEQTARTGMPHQPRGEDRVRTLAASAPH